MKQRVKPAREDKRVKMAMIIALFTGSGLITCSGLMFLVYSVAQNIRLNILGASIPGVIVALVMLFFGIRSFITIRRIKGKMLENTPTLS